jgi:hypothetical protein
MGFLSFSLVITYAMLSCARTVCAAVVGFGISLCYWVFSVIIFAGGAAVSFGYHNWYTCWRIFFGILYMSATVISCVISLILHATVAIVSYGVSLIIFAGAIARSCGFYILYACYWISLIIIYNPPSSLWTFTFLLTAFLLTWVFIAKGLRTEENSRNSWLRSMIHGAALNLTPRKSDSTKPVVVSTRKTHDTINKAIETPSGAEGGEQIVIAVMGVTGAGKSSFIKNVTGSQDVLVGHDLESSTVFRLLELISYISTNLHKLHRRSNPTASTMKAVILC